MTREEAVKFLNDTKVYVNGKSEEIQKTLFSLGFKCCDGSQEVKKVTYPFLFLHNGYISYDDDMVFFTKCSYREINSEDVCNITIGVSNYRSFKDAKECWNEMLKHQPFVCLKHKEKQIYDTCICVGKNGIEELSYEFMYKYYTFADGTPFGIKED